MATRLTASLLLGVLWCGPRSNDGAAAFNAVRPTISARRTVLSLSKNGVDAGEDTLEPAATRKLGRRDALARFAAVATAAASWGGGATRAAIAADAAVAIPVSEFSESPTSEAAIGRMGYDGKTLAVSPPPAEKPQAVSTPSAEKPPALPAPSPPSAEKPPAGFSEETGAAPKSDAEAFLATEKAAPVKLVKEMKDFDGNEAGPIGSSDEGSQPLAKVNPDEFFRGGVFDKSRSSPLNDSNSSDTSVLATLVESVDPRIVPVALFGVLALLNKDDFNGQDNEVAAPGFKKGGKKLPTPYGFDQGRNYWDGVDMNAAKRAGLINSPPPKTEEELAAEAAAAAEAKIAKERPRAPEPPPPSWVLPKPTPYGVANEGRNPFIQDVLEYCEGGKVTGPCTESIKGYLEDIAETGAVATSGETTAIVGYINSLGDEEGDGDAPVGDGAAAAAFVGYLDALSAGSAPPPTSAKAVKNYLDTMNGTVAARASAAVVANQLQRSPSDQMGPPAAAAPGPDTSEFNTRLAGVEGRVADLEIKVDQIPDRVFQKVEAWQVSREEQLTESVKRVVREMAPATEEPAATAEKADPPLAPESEMWAGAPALEPVVVPASFLPAAVPSRPAVPGVGGAGPRKGFGLGGGGGWKTAASSTPVPTWAATEQQPAAAVVPAQADAAAAVEPAVTSPAAVSPTPLAGAIPARPAMPQPGSNSAGVKTSYGLGSGGANWKEQE